jgi:WD40 repeat protein/energy-coupling factor transporter ATP-binding protein EcfA2
MDNISVTKILSSNPYPGIRSYEPNEYHLFYGRETSLAEIVSKLGKSRLLAVTGASGSGKSSLIRAGLIPILKDKVKYDNQKIIVDNQLQKYDWRIVILTPGKNPIENLTISLETNLKDEINSINQETKRLLLKRLLTDLNNTDKEEQPNILTQIIKLLNEQSPKNTLILVDQFEEIFRLKDNLLAENQKETTNFILNLINLSNQESASSYVVITMRSDFLDDCTEYRELFDAINNGLYLVPRMTKQEMENVIRKPLELSGTLISDDLVLRLLNEVGDKSDELPILQHSMMRMWDFWNRTKKDVNETIEMHHYEAIGTMERAISFHGEEIFEKIVLNKGKIGADITEKIFKSLVFIDGGKRATRRKSTIKEIIRITDSNFDDVIDIIDRFRDKECGFIVVEGKDRISEESIVDISHESIMRVWDRMRNWVEEEEKSVQLYKRLAKAGELYEEGNTGLWGNPDLQFAIDWQIRYKPNREWGERYDYGFDRAISFLEYSKKQYNLEIINKENKQKRELQRARKFVIILGAASIVSLIFLIVSLNFLMKSEASEKKARENEKIAFSRSKEADRETRKAVIQTRISEQQGEIAIEQRKLTEEQRKYAIIQKTIAEGEKVKAEKERKNAEIARDEANKAREIADEQKLKAEDNWLFALKEKKKAEDEQKKARESEQNAKRLRLLALARNVAIQANKLQSSVKGDLPSLLALQAYLFNKNNGGDIINPDIYNALASVADDRPKLRKHQDGVRQLEFSKNAKYFVSASDDGSVRIWNLEWYNSESVKLNTNGYGKNGFRSVAISPNSRFIAAGSNDGAVLVWEFDGNFDPQKNSDMNPKVFTGHNGIITSLSFSQDNQELASTGTDKTLRIWNLKNPQNSKIIERSNSKLTDVVYSPDGVYLARASEDGSIYFYFAKDLSKKPIIMESSGKSITSIAFNSSSKFFAAGNSSGLVKVWNLNLFNAKPIELIGHISIVSDIKFSDKQGQIASSSYDGSIRLWNYEDLTLQPIVITDIDGWIYSIAFGPNSNQLISGDSEKFIRVYTSNIDLLAGKICVDISRNMTIDEWNRYIGSDISYEKTCSNLP